MTTATQRRSIAYFSLILNQTQTSEIKLHAPNTAASLAWLWLKFHCNSINELIVAIVIHRQLTFTSSQWWLCITHTPSTGFIDLNSETTKIVLKKSTSNYRLYFVTVFHHWDGWGFWVMGYLGLHTLIYPIKHNHAHVSWDIITLTS